jgi:hypothetical protein
MNKTKVFSLFGFLAAVGTATALIGSATGATGAYFTDSHTGTLQASTGHLTLNVTNTTLDFSNLVPGVYTTQTIDYNTNSNVNEDVWLTFPSGPAYDNFTGPTGASDAPGGGLGGYGHFAVSDTHGGSFTSYNLQDAPAGDVTDPQCTVDANGDGGSNAQATGPNNGSQSAPLCGVPQAILLASNLASGSTGEITLTFGVTGKWTLQNTALGNVPFNVVATQTGVRPDALNF